MSPNTACEDREAIHQLLVRLATTADYAEDLDDYARLLTDDVEFVFPDNPESGLAASRFTGREAAVAGAQARREAGIQGPGTHTKHVVLLEEIEIIDSDTARAENSWAFYTDTHRTPVLNSLGRHSNEFRRVGGEWKLAKRVAQIG